jgi:hypothetical protein
LDVAERIEILLKDLESIEIIDSKNLPLDIDKFTEILNVDKELLKFLI